jgi:hypothetical protein
MRELRDEEMGFVAGGVSVDGVRATITITTPAITIPSRTISHSNLISFRITTPEIHIPSTTTTIDP